MAEHENLVGARIRVDVRVLDRGALISHLDCSGTILAADEHFVTVAPDDGSETVRVPGGASGLTWDSVAGNWVAKGENHRLGRVRASGTVIVDPEIK